MLIAITNLSIFASLTAHLSVHVSLPFSRPFSPVKCASTGKLPVRLHQILVSYHKLRNHLKLLQKNALSYFSICSYLRSSALAHQYCICGIIFLQVPFAYSYFFAFTLCITCVMCIDVEYAVVEVMRQGRR